MALDSCPVQDRHSVAPDPQHALVVKHGSFDIKKASQMKQDELVTVYSSLVKEPGHLLAVFAPLGLDVASRRRQSLIQVVAPAEIRCIACSAEPVVLSMHRGSGCLERVRTPSACRRKGTHRPILLEGSCRRRAHRDHSGFAPGKEQRRGQRRCAS